MTSKTLSKWFSYLLVIVFVNLAFSQSVSLSEKEITDNLKSYIDRLLVRYGKQNIEKERYLVQQIRMINNEIKSRVGNVKEKRAQYFNGAKSLCLKKRNTEGNTPKSGHFPTFTDQSAHQTNRELTLSSLLMRRIASPSRGAIDDT